MPEPARKYPRGRVRPADLDGLIRASHDRHGARLKALATPTAPSFDWRTLGKVPPVKDQRQCGSCWDFSGCGTATMALIQAGTWPADGSEQFSEQYFLDCVSDGGCDGDDNTTVLQALQAHGGPTEAAYGPYEGGEQRCRIAASTPLLKIADWGFAGSDGGQGVASVADIKEALVAYGPVGCAVAAGDDWDEYSGGVSAGSGSTEVNHDVMIVGWQDDAAIEAGGFWIVRNSWGPAWGEAGYMRLEYGADLIGTETVWAQATATPTPNPAPSPTPAPVPVPPPPGPAPSPTPSTSTVGTFDPAAKTLILPAGWSSKPAGMLVLLPDRKMALVPKEWTVSTQPASTPKAAFNWAGLLQLLVTVAPEVIQLFAAAAPKADATPEYNPSPATLEDALTNDDVLAGLQATVAALGITDAAVVASIDSLGQANLATGYAALQAYAAAQNLTAPPLVSHGSSVWELDPQATPPTLAVVEAIPASQVPIPSAPSPAPSPTPAPASKPKP